MNKREQFAPGETCPLGPVTSSEVGNSRGARVALWGEQQGKFLNHLGPSCGVPGACGCTSWETYRRDMQTGLIPRATVGHAVLERVGLT